MNNIVISAFEKVETLGLENLDLEKSCFYDAKIDTGAFSGVIHAQNIVEHNGTLYFNLYGSSQDIATTDFLVRKVRNTHGGSKKRYLVNMKIKIRDHIYIERLGLDDRSNMKYNVLIGRAFLIRNNIMVDCRESRNIDNEWREMGDK